MTKLEYLRHEKRLSRRKLAEMAGITDDTIRRIEVSDHPENVKVSTYNRIAKALNVGALDVMEDNLLVWNSYKKFQKIQDISLHAKIYLV